MARSDYVQLVNATLWVKKSLGVKKPSSELNEEGEKGSVRNKKAKTIVSQGSHWISDKKPQCKDCERNHTRMCRRKNITCSLCGKKGHYKNECQNKMKIDEEGSMQRQVASHSV